MSRDNVELAQRAYAAFNDMLRRGEVDHELIVRYWTADCVLKPSGLLPESAEMHGHEGIAQFVRNQIEAFDEFHIEALEFVDAGDRLVIPVRFGGKARYTGMDVAFEIVHVPTVRDGKVARLDMYRERGEALEAVGMQDSG